MGRSQDGVLEELFFATSQEKRAGQHGGGSPSSAADLRKGRTARELNSGWIKHSNPDTVAC